MRYYYYGKEPDIRGSSQWTGTHGSEDGSKGWGKNLYETPQIVYDEDTIYEIDEECEECRKRGISPMQYRLNQK